MTCLQTGNYTLELEYTLIFSGSFAKLQKNTSAFMIFLPEHVTFCQLVPNLIENAKSVKPIQKVQKNLTN